MFHIFLIFCQCHYVVGLTAVLTLASDLSGNQFVAIDWNFFDFITGNTASPSSLNGAYGNILQGSCAYLVASNELESIFCPTTNWVIGSSIDM